MRKYLCLLLLVGCAQPNPPAKPINGDKIAILVKGWGPGNSDGLYDYVTSLNNKGYSVAVINYTDQIVLPDYKKLVLIGHSFGGRKVVELSQVYKTDLLVTLDGSQGTNPLLAQPISLAPQAKEVLVYCIPSTPILDKWPCPRMSGEFRVMNVPLGVDHLNIDSNAKIRNEIMDAVP